MTPISAAAAMLPKPFFFCFCSFSYPPSSFHFGELSLFKNRFYYVIIITCGCPPVVWFNTFIGTICVVNSIIVLSGLSTYALDNAQTARGILKSGRPVDFIWYRVGFVLPASNKASVVFSNTQHCMMIKEYNLASICCC